MSDRRVRLLLVAAVSLIIALAACAGPDAADPNMTVAQEQMGVDWPLTVPSGVIGCVDNFGVTITVDGVAYSLNGTGTGTGRYLDIRPIWADDPQQSGVKQDLSPLIKEALSRCGG